MLRLLQIEEYPNVGLLKTLIPHFRVCCRNKPIDTWFPSTFYVRCTFYNTHSPILSFVFPQFRLFSFYFILSAFPLYLYFSLCVGVCLCLLHFFFCFVSSQFLSLHFKSFSSLDDVMGGLHFWGQDREGKRCQKGKRNG